MVAEAHRLRSLGSYQVVRNAIQSLEIWKFSVSCTDTTNANVSGFSSCPWPSVLYDFKSGAEQALRVAVYIRSWCKHLQAIFWYSRLVMF